MKVFQKGLTGLVAIAAVTSVSIMAPAQAQSIQQTIKAADAAKKEASAAPAKVQAAQKAYDGASSNANKAKTIYDNSKAAEINAKKKYDDSKAYADTKKTELDNADKALKAVQSQFNNADTALKAAKTQFGNADTALKDAKTQFGNADKTLKALLKNKNVAKADLDTAQNNYNTAKATQDTAQSNYNTVKATQDAAQNNYNSTNDTYTKAAKTANDNFNAYQTAQTKATSDLTSYQTAQSVADQTLATLQNTQQMAQKANETANTTAIAAQGAWGNWSKTLSVQDKSLDKSGFQTIIPMFQKLVQKEGVTISGDQIAAKRLDPNQLFLQQAHDVRVWFLNEGAAYKNQLAYEATRGDQYEKAMIFNDVSCDSTKNKCELGEKDGVLDIGDFVDLGKFKANTQFNFLIKSDGASVQTRNGDIYGGDASLNPDGIQHLMAWQVGDYLMLGFEDLRGGGDKDYNDVMFVVDFGKGNLKTTAVPEPGNMTALLGVTGASLWLRRRRQTKTSV